MLIYTNVKFMQINSDLRYFVFMSVFSLYQVHNSTEIVFVMCMQITYFWKKNVFSEKLLTFKITISGRAIDL